VIGVNTRWSQRWKALINLSKSQLSPEAPTAREFLPRTRPATGLRGAVTRLNFRSQEVALLPVIVLVLIVGEFVTPVFLSNRNVINVLQQSSELSIVVVGLSLILITGKFDLSLESTFGLAPMVGAWMVVSRSFGGSGAQVPGWAAVLLVVALGAAVGAVNAFFVIRLRLNAFIVTLAALILLRGIDLGVVGGKTMFGMPRTFVYLGSAVWLGVPLSVWAAGFIFVTVGLFLRYHRVGRALYIIGGNREAARAAGINVERVQWGVFMGAGILAAIAGLALAGRVASVTPSQGQNLIFSAFAAAVIGGISLNGGRGTMFGAFLGVLLLGLITNLLTLSQIPSYWVDATNGAIILAAITISRFTAARDLAD
jgi:simple sugar transport system permease protein